MTPIAPARRVLLGVSLVCFANLLLEVVLTRIFSATMFYHFTFLAIALALFGLGASGVYVYVHPARFTEETLAGDLARASRRFAAATLVALIYVLANPIQIINPSGHAPLLTNKVVMQMLLLCGVTALPFFFAGLVVALAVTHYRRHIGRLYFFDLCGAGLAALAAGLLLGLFGGPSLVIVIATCALAAALLFTRPKGWRSFLPLGAVVLLLVANLAVGFVAVPSGKGVENQRLLFEKWNSFSRVTVEKLRPGDYDIKIDASASTRVTSGTDGADWRRDISSIAYALFSPPVRQALVIGPGGGRDIAHALAAGTHHVVGVEVNPIIADTIMRHAFVTESRGLYSDPRVHVLVDEGRSFVRRSHDRYDVIQASLVDTWAATAAGAFALTENTLYTLEAFEDYYAHLTDRGVVTMTRWYSGAGGETARLVLLAAGALERQGVPANQVRAHLFLAKDKQHGTLIAKKTPFTPAELARLHAACKAAHFDVVVEPGPITDAPPAGATLDVLIDSGSWSPLVRAERQDLVPPTDDRPFFFYFAKPGDIWRMAKRLGDKTALTDPALWVLLAFGLAVIALALAFIVLPLVLHRSDALRGGGPGGGERRAVALVYFGAIGLAFITVEVALLQKFTFFLGQPVYSLLVVLFSLLVGTAIGARLSGLVRDARRGTLVLAGGAGLLVLFTVYALVLGPLLRAWIGWPLAARILLSALLAGGSGLAMGIMLPTGVRLTSDQDAEVIPWAWGINGAASVIGTVGSTIVAIHAGFTVTLLVGAAFYGLAGGAGVALATLVKRAAFRVSEPVASEPAAAAAQ